MEPNKVDLEYIQGLGLSPSVTLVVANLVQNANEEIVFPDEGGDELDNALRSCFETLDLIYKEVAPGIESDTVHLFAEYIDLPTMDPSIVSAMPFALSLAPCGAMGIPFIDYAPWDSNDIVFPRRVMFGLGVDSGGGLNIICQTRVWQWVVDTLIVRAQTGENLYLSIDEHEVIRQAMDVEAVRAWIIDQLGTVSVYRDDLPKEVARWRFNVNEILMDLAFDDPVHEQIMTTIMHHVCRKVVDVTRLVCDNTGQVPTIAPFVTASGDLVTKIQYEGLSDPWLITPGNLEDLTPNLLLPSSFDKIVSERGESAGILAAFEIEQRQE